jgi:hypothetical protein
MTSLMSKGSGFTPGWCWKLVFWVN